MQNFSAFGSGNTEIAAYQWLADSGSYFKTETEIQTKLDVGINKGCTATSMQMITFPAQCFSGGNLRDTFIPRFFDFRPILGTAEVFGDTNKTTSGEFDTDSKSEERIRLSLTVVELQAVTKFWKFRANVNRYPDRSINRKLIKLT